MNQIIHPIFKSNEDGNLQFQNGQLDVMQQFVPQIWKMWEGGKPVGTYLKEKPYYVPGSIPMFFMNTTKPGLSDPAVRKAMAWAIDYESIAETAMSGYSGQVHGLADPADRCRVEVDRQVQGRVRRLEVRPGQGREDSQGRRLHEGLRRHLRQGRCPPRSVEADHPDRAGPTGTRP